MKKLTQFSIFSLLLSILYNCSAYKSASNKMVKGNYAEAFETSIKLFSKNSSQRKKVKQLELLQNSYMLANRQDEFRLQNMRTKSDPNYKDIYYLVKTLYDRENLIKPYLPLYKNNKELKFSVKNYSLELEQAKEDFLNDYYTSALKYLTTKKKSNARSAYNLLKEVQEVDYNYRDVNIKLEEAYKNGIERMYVTAVNQTGHPLPENFKDNLLYNLNNEVNSFWMRISTSKPYNMDHEIRVVLNRLYIGKDDFTKKSKNFDKDIVDGWEYEKDGRGNVIKDSLGNTKKVDKHVIVRATVTEFKRTKDAKLDATIEVYDPNGNIEIYDLYGYVRRESSITSKFIFESVFAEFEGDERALNRRELDLIKKTPVAFPTDYDMINECIRESRKELIYFLSSYYKIKKKKPFLFP
ncbi:hypothetical protein O2K51_02755 [Apibacter raozihei]|uniref:hypothetical protein n=1 Tax=Apibacter raozihei TaxID=2500547 RepID=UPI000FE3E573|nr:hypothetical protein [Apibacter raozihei]